MLSISKDKLRASKPENLQRLAKSLNLKMEGMSHEELVALIYWSIEIGSILQNVQEAIVEAEIPVMIDLG